METWAQMEVRHQKERRALLAAASGFDLPMSQAAKEIGMKRDAFKSALKRHGLTWDALAVNEKKYRRRKMMADQGTPMSVAARLLAISDSALEQYSLNHNINWSSW